MIVENITDDLARVLTAPPGSSSQRQARRYVTLRESRTLAQKYGDAGLKLQAHHASWATSFGRGKLAGVAPYFSSAVVQVLRDVALAGQHAEASWRIATEDDLAMLRAWSTGVAGWCAAEHGDADCGVAARSGHRLASHSITSFHVLSARNAVGRADSRRADTRHMRTLSDKTRHTRLMMAPGRRRSNVLFWLQFFAKTTAVGIGSAPKRK
jgi:hypothetical protein